jgi:hypothetical protein
LYNNIFVPSGASAEVEVCVTMSGFYGMVTYVVVTTLLLSFEGVRVVRGRVRRHRSGRSPNEEVMTPSQQLPAMESIELADLVPERRAPPSGIASEVPFEVPYEDLLMRVLRGGPAVNNNPFH